MDKNVMKYSKIYRNALLSNNFSGADMKVELLNDGPVTILYDSEIWRKK